MFRVIVVWVWLISSFACSQRSTFGNSTATPVTARTSTSSLPPSEWNDSSNFIPLLSEQAGCNIFGPLCQTGTVTVSIGLNSITTTTAVPCSSYLSAQSRWIAGQMNGAYSPAILWPPNNKQASSLLSSFGRSPECTSFANAAYPGVGNLFKSSVPEPNLPGCPNNDSGSLAPWKSYIPYGINRFWGGHYFDCCDGCTLNIPRVRVLYFPDPSASPCKNGSTTNSSTIARDPLTTSFDNAEKRADMLVTAVYSGSTLTSPSIYLEVIGTANVTDFCGVVGAQYTNPIIPLPPGALSSYSWNVPVGGEISYQDNFFQADATKVVQVSDLACPTWGIGTARPSSANAVVGPPFNPLIAPPPQLQSYDPQWAKCAAFTTAGDHLLSWAIHDPPHALVPESGLSPGPTVPADPPTTKITSIVDPSLPETTSAAPIPTPSSVAPQTTYTSVFHTSSRLDPVAGPSSAPDAGQSALQSPQSSISLGQSRVETALQDPLPSVQDPASLPPGDPKSFPTQSSAVGLGGIILSAFYRNSDTDVIPGPSTVMTIDGTAITIQPSLVAIGGTTVAADSPSATVAGVPFFDNPSKSQEWISTYTIPSPSGTTPDPSPYALNGQPFTAIEQSAIEIAGTTLTAGGNALTLSGSVYSVAPSGNVVVGPLASNIPAEILTIGNQPITIINPGAIIAEGSTLTPGASALIIAGTPISLPSPGVVVYGGSTATLTFPTPAPTAKVFTVAGQTLTADPSAFAIGGTTFTAGGAAVTISGTPVSLKSGGVLVIGTSTNNLGSGDVFTVAGQALTADASTFMIDGTTITAGGAGITISGTPISLEPGGTLVIGTSTIDLGSASAKSGGMLVTATKTLGDMFTVAGHTLTADASNIMIDGTTIAAGGPGVAISGTPISLGPGGTLIIGTSTIDLGSASSAVGPTSATATAVGTTGLLVQPYEGADVRVEPGRGLKMALVLGGVCAVWLGWGS